MTEIPYEAIIFDMDGLLVDSETIWNVAETEMFEAHGFSYTAEVRALIVGLRLDEMMTKMKTVYDLPQTETELATELTDRMIEIIPKNVKPQPGAHELIQYVAERDFTRAIASSSPMSIIDAILDSQGWGDVFPRRFSADDDMRGKPAPDVYLRAAAGLGANPANCLALEDSPNGARAAVAAGMTCFAVPDRSHSTPEAFADITPHVFTTLHEVLVRLKNGEG
jgi:sugar-phosphatase